MTPADVLRTSVFALRGNWMRSTLTSLGVIIGIAAVIIMVSVGKGTQAGDRQDGLRPGQQPPRHLGGAPNQGGVRGAGGNNATLTDTDATAIREQIPKCSTWRPACAATRSSVYAENNWSTSWQGVQPDFFEINGWTLASGEGLQAGDYSSAAKSVVIGETVRRELFADEDPLGQALRIGKVPFTVVGVLAPKGRAASARTRTTW
jgi:putative ABC transport system permease protein